MKRQCPRCGERFEILTMGQRYDLRCQREVDAIIAADERRRMPRAQAKDFTGTTAL